MACERNLEDMRALREQVLQLQKDFYEHAKDVNNSLKQIFDYISQEIGARRERENSISALNQSAELTWTKIMAVSAIIGGVQAAPAIFHAIFH